MRRRERDLNPRVLRQWISNPPQYRAMRSRLESCLQRHSHKHDAIRRTMLIRFHGREHDKSYDFEDSVKLRDALLKCGILPSTVVVSYQDQILPLSTIITSDIELLVTTVSSGG